MDSFTIPLSNLHTTGLWWFIVVLTLLLVVLLKVRNASGWSKYLGFYLIAVIFCGFCYVFIHSWQAKISVSEDEFTFDVPLYGKSFPLSSLDTANIQEIDLTHHQDFKIKYRQNGIGLPGYQLGYFQLETPYQGTSKALLSVTDSTKVIVLPIKDNLLLLFSVDNPQQTLRQLKKLP